MPANYAHYRFGAAMLEGMPADISRTVKRFRQLYDVGLHGPDPFFYYNPVMHNKVGELASRFHQQSGVEFFGRICRSLRLEPSDAAQAYLYGVLCHYCLDSTCHPFINEKSEEGPATHVEIEAEFDRYLFEMDEKCLPEQQDTSPHMRLTQGECETMARFYPGTTAGQVRTSVRNMALVAKLMATPAGMKRDLLLKSVKAFSKTGTELMIPATPNLRCAELDATLKTYYDQAAKRFPELLAQLNAHLTYSAPLGEEFKKSFG